MEKLLSHEEAQFINEQVDLLEEVKTALRHHISTQGTVDMKKVADSIDALKAEIKDGRERDLPALFYELNLQYSLAKRLSEVGNDIPSLAEPYFGYMKLEENGKFRRILLGHNSFIQDRDNFRIVDWKKAPIAKLFYQYSEGEEFEFDLRDKTIEGVIAEHCVLTIENGQLQRVQRNGKTYINEDNKWFCLDLDSFKLEGGQGSASRELGFGTGLTNYKTGNVVALLDGEQYNLINRNLSEPLLIIGGAGSGKTTVALHRIALICKRKKLFPNQVLVVVPNQGLVSLSRKLLESVGLQKVKVVTDTEWLKAQCYQLINNLPSKINDFPPLSVSIIKRHGSFLNIIDRYLSEKEIEIIDKIKSMTGIQEVAQIFASYKDLALVQKIDRFKHQNIHDSLKRMRIDDLRNQLMNIRETLLEILSNTNLMNEIVKLSENIITHRMVDELLLHTGRQLHEKEDNDKSYRDHTIDGKELNDSTEFAVQGTMDAEDIPLMLYLLKCLNGSIRNDRGQIKNYRHIVLDEVQELSPVELRIFSHCIANQGTMTIAGDAAQQIDKTISFNSWDGVLEELGMDDISPEELTISYRSPRSIIEFSHKVLGPFAPANMPEAKREGAPVKIDKMAHHAGASLVIYEALNDLLMREPKASVAVICSNNQTARMFYEELNELGKVRLVENADFDFKPGIDITTVEQIRGLEFDYVILPDVNQKDYPNEARARKRLHLAATRAIHQLWVIYSDNPSLIIKDII